MIKQKSRVVATYSKRKQFRRIVKDNWQDSENVFHTSVSKPLNQNPLTSTPIGKGRQGKKTATSIFGSLPNTQQDDRYPLKDISHPRQVSGKRACRRPPILNITPEPSQEVIDYSADLFDSSNKSSDKESCVNKSLDPCLKTPDISETAAPQTYPNSPQQKPTDVASFSLGQSEFSSQFLTTVGDKNLNHLVVTHSMKRENICDSAGVSEDRSSLPSAMEVSVNFSPDCSSVDKSNEQELSMELSKMSVQAISPEPLGDMSIEKENSVKEISPEPMGDKENSSLESPMLSPNKVVIEEEQSCMVLACNLPDLTSLEKSINQAVEEEQIAVLDRSLMLATTIPSYTKLLSQCRRVKDLLTLVQHDLADIRKIGEGSFGEVFMGGDTVYKIVPVGGDVEINDVEQTSFENAFQEIAVSRKLSDLAGDQVQMGKAFCQLKDVVFCKGKYPEVLLKAWDNFNGTENQRPDVLLEDQMYVVLLCKYSGVQLEEYCEAHKLTPDQAHSIVRQICCSLAAAEQRYEFEHRDLHWGNVLIAETDMKHVDFAQDGKEYILRSHGLLATIIDFTFSRLETEGCLNYVDLEQEDWLFLGDVKADIQYRVYRDMRSACRKNWAKFTPKTNVLWILYLVDKMNVKIRSPKLRKLRQALQSCKSASTALPIAFRSL